MTLSILAPLHFLCQNGPGYGPDYGPGMGLFGGYHMMSPFGGGLLLVLFLALVFIVLTRVVRRPESGGESALDILKKRYARGEISREDYERMRQDLKD